MILKIDNKRATDREMYGTKGAYPYLKFNKEIPVELVQITPYFVTVKVLPHLCVIDAFKESYPYNITVDRRQLERGEILLL